MLLNNPGVFPLWSPGGRFKYPEGNLGQFLEYEWFMRRRGMRIEDYFDFLGSGDIRIKGHRIGIEDVLHEYICNDRTPEELAVRFPTLNLEQIYATILYYLHDKERISRYMDEWAKHGDQMRKMQNRNPGPAIIKLRKIAARRKTGSQANEQDQVLIG